MLTRFVKWLIAVANEWYLNETETLVQITGMLTQWNGRKRVDPANDKSVMHLQKVWNTLMQSRGWSALEWDQLWNEINVRHMSNLQYLNTVTDMIATFIPRESAQALTNILSTNANISRRQREELVALYREYKLLSCFDDKTLVPMSNSSLVATGREGCRTRFKCTVMQCLPMTFSSEQIREIENQLSATRTNLVQCNIVKVMMEGCGVEVPIEAPVTAPGSTSQSLNDGDKINTTIDPIGPIDDIKGEFPLVNDKKGTPSSLDKKIHSSKAVKSIWLTR